MIAAIRSGTCDYGIVAWVPDLEGIANFVPEEGYLDIDAVGVTRHARHPDSAQRLVEWLLENNKLRVPGAYARRHVGLAGWRDEDARLLIERVGYQ